MYKYSRQVPHQEIYRWQIGKENLLNIIQKVIREMQFKIMISLCPHLRKSNWKTKSANPNWGCGTTGISIHFWERMQNGTTTFLKIVWQWFTKLSMVLPYNQHTCSLVFTQRSDVHISVYVLVVQIMSDSLAAPAMWPTKVHSVHVELQPRTL